MTLLSPFNDLDTAGNAFARVRAEIDAVPADQISAMNVDLVGATSLVLGVADRILPFRERMLKLPEFDAKSIDSLVDYALAAWFAYVTNLPTAQPEDVDALLAELSALRAKLLLWAVPLAASGKLDSLALEKIQEGSGQKDSASDVLSLVGLYRSNWEAIKTICAVTEEDLSRGGQIAPLVFAMVSRRENKGAATASDASLRVRRAWTLLDRAYGQCRRALYFLRFTEDDTDRIAPNIRRNAGPPGKAAAAPNTAAPNAAAANADANSAAADPTPGNTANSSQATPPAGPGLGGNGSPFAAPTAQR